MTLHPQLLGPRVESFWVEHLDENDQVLESRLRGVRGGSVEGNADSTIYTGCTLEIAHLDQGIDWYRHRFRPWVLVNRVAWPLGIYLPQSPEAIYTEDGQYWKIAGLDKLSVLDQDKIDETFSLPQGTTVTEAARDLIISAGETSITLTDSDATLPEMIAWLPKTSKLRIINDLMNSIDYAHVWVDRFGRYRLEPAIEPDKRPVKAEFVQGQTAIHSPRFTRTQDVLAVPNKVVMETQGTDSTPSLRSVATNQDPDSPYSYQNRGGRWITKTYDNAEAVDQAALDSQARRNLSNSSTPPAYLKVEHALVPLDLNDVVMLSDSDLVRVQAAVNEYKIQFEVGAQVEALWKELNGAEPESP